MVDLPCPVLLKTSAPEPLYLLNIINNDTFAFPSNFLAKHQLNSLTSLC